jgi:DNA-binding NarL/FixJ family response regulator
LIQDIKFGDSNASDFINEINKKFPNLKILILSSISNSISIRQMLRKVDGYVLKSESISEICKGIEQIHKGQNYLSVEVSKKLNSFQNNEILLTRREKEVLEVIMQEKSTKEIADILFISQKTVEMHRSNLFLKLDVKNVTGLVKQVIALDLLGD